MLYRFCLQDTEVEEEVMLEAQKGPGDCFGDNSLGGGVENKLHKLRAVALTNVQVIVVEAVDFRRINLLNAAQMSTDEKVRRGTWALPHRD